MALWDGIENAGWGVHEDNPPTWKDLTSNGYDITWNITPGGFACHTIYDDAVGNGYPGYGWGYNLNIGSWTWIEAVFLWDGTGGSTSQRLVFTFSDGTALNLSTYNDTNTIRGVVLRTGSQRAFTVGATANVINARQCVQMGRSSGLRVYVNGVDCVVGAESAVGWTPTTSGMYIGAEGNTMRGFNGKIYGIRIYDRELTDNERLANYAVDKARFSIPDAT